MDTPGLRLCDWFIFHKAAQAFEVWILVRWTNAESLKYIGKRAWEPAAGRVLEYVPKGIDCKPKTADIDVAGYELAGLVVDPTVHKAFAKDSQASGAAKKWKEVLAGVGARDSKELNAKNLNGVT